MIQDQRRHWNNERGSVVAFVVVIPALVLMLAVIVQIAIVGHVRHVAAVTADAGLGQVAAADGSVDAAVGRMEQGLSGTSSWVKGSSVTARRGDEEASVRVQVSALKVFPLVNGTVVVERSAPVERPAE